MKGYMEKIYEVNFFSYKFVILNEVKDPEQLTWILRYGYASTQNDS